VAVSALGDGSHAGAPGPVAAQAPARPPVIFLTLDELPVDSLLGPDGRIDAARYPNFAALAAMSTWYPNAATVHDSTSKAVPAILDAKLPRSRVPATVQGHKESVFTLFGRQGYRIVASEEATSMCPRRYCPHARGGVGRIKKLMRAGRKARFASWVRSIRPGSPTFYYKHVYLPHGPRVFLPSGKQVPKPADSLVGLSTTRGYNDPGLTNHNHMRYLLQLAYTDRELGRLLAKLRRERLLDKALIAVAADHGYAFDVRTADRRLLTHRNVDELAPVPLFIKTPSQRQGIVDKAYVRTIDIVPTMAASLGLRLHWPHAGRPASDPAVRKRQGISLVSRDFKGTIAIGPGALQKRRRANIRFAARLFGTGARSKRLYGSPYASLYRIGPNRGLIGRKLTGLRTTGPGSVTIQVPDARLWRSVNRASPVIPSRVAGTIWGGGPGATRDLAVAVNGRVQAVGRSLHLIGGSPELFSVLVPESSLRQGRNDVRVYQVSRQGRGLVLTLLRRP
jgi:Sulfatase